MSIRVYVNTASKRAETQALLDTGATENFMSLQYAKHLRLPIKRMAKPRPVYNVDGTPNKAGQIDCYTDLEMQSGQKRIYVRFFLTELGERTMILGYPSFAAFQFKVDWAKGWLDYAHLPVVLRTKKAHLAVIKAKGEKRRPRERIMMIGVTIAAAEGRQTQASKLAEEVYLHTKGSEEIPPEYQQHGTVFSEEEAQRFPKPRIWDHTIELKPDAPASLPGKIYPLTQGEQEALKEFIKEHLKKGYIRPSKSPYAAPFFFIKKKDGKLRPVQDYRRLNEWTIRNKYPLPLIPELIRRVKGASLFSKFDIRWGYNNVRIKEGDEWKAAFVTNEGLFEPRVMFFGLTNSPATFQSMMNAIFAEELRERNEQGEGWLTIYMDDILVHTQGDIEFHRKCVHRVLTKLKEHDLFLKPAKCHFEQTRIEFLGVVLTKGTVQMDPIKTKGIADWPQPRNVTDVRAFLGFTGFYRYFIPGYANIARPLLELTKKATVFHWSEGQQKAFEHLKTLLCQRPILRQPEFDKAFFIATDASAYGVGAVLLQEGELHPKTHKPALLPVAYFSKTFLPAERNYDIYEKEYLAMQLALEHWRPYVAGTIIPVTVLTDHANLIHWKKPQKVNRRVVRWELRLQDYNIVIKHVSEKSHVLADALSRLPGMDRGQNNNDNITLLPERLFVNVTMTETITDDYLHDLEQEVAREQQKHQTLIQGWEQKGEIQARWSDMAEQNLWHHQG